MAITTVKANNDGAWANARPVPTGHFADYLPGPRILRLHDPSGNKIAETGVPEGVRDFSAYIATNGEIVVLFSSFNNDQSPWPWRKWTTGAFVGAATPAPAPTGNPQTIAAIKAKIAELQSLVNALT